MVDDTDTGHRQAGASDPYTAPRAAVDRAAGDDPRVWPRGIVATLVASVLGAVLIVLAERGPFAFTVVHGGVAIVALWVLAVLWVLAPTARIVGGWRYIPLAAWARVTGAMVLVLGTLTFLLSTALFVAWVLWVHRDGM